MDVCRDSAEFVEERIDRINTFYRESPKLIHVMRVYVGQLAEAARVACSLPTFFDIDTAIGDQLTLVGKRMGFPRCHCVCDIQPVFGFECEGYNSGYTIVGFCDESGAWADCGPFGTSDICITDDEVYRTFLKARRYQMQALFDIESLTAAVQHLFGPQARIISAGVGRIVVAPGRAMTAQEQTLLQIYPRVLPVAPGIRIRFHFGAMRVFGFGDGWGTFCEEWLPDGAPLLLETGETLVTEDDLDILTGPLTKDAPFLCEVDTKPYDCA